MNVTLFTSVTVGNLHLLVATPKIRNIKVASKLLDELNNTHPWLAQEICTRSAHAAVSEASAGVLDKKNRR